VLFGNRQAFVRTAIAGTTLVVVVPPDLPPGTVPVTVTVAAQTSNAVNFTVLAPEPVTLIDHIMSGGPVPGGCNAPAIKNNFLSTDADASSGLMSPERGWATSCDGNGFSPMARCTTRINIRST
jgi:hypothetical protein